MLKETPCFFDLDDYPKDFAPSHKRILSARKIAFGELNKPLSALINVSKLAGAMDAAKLIYQSILASKRIVIVGDYDADGATSTALMLKVFNHLQVKVEHIIPNRITMGYGLSAVVVEQAITLGAELVITVDNGISAVAATETLRKADIAVIITDHHLPPKVLPDANVIVNPNQVGCEFASKNLAGVGVAFYVMLALRQVLKLHGDGRLDDFNMASLLDLVAVGTVADLVPLDFNNRILVDQGLKRIRAGNSTVGIQALIQLSELEQARLSSVEIAYQIAPKINAAGRVADMSLGVDCLMANNSRLAMDYAIELLTLNNERKAIENEMKIQATSIIEKIKVEDNCAALCLFDSSWHEGVIGILASRVKEEYKKVALMFTRSGAVLKGSARSTNEVNIVEVLNKINIEYPELIISYGGHAKAAGLTINAANFEQFEQQLQNTVNQTLDAIVLDKSTYTDGTLLPYELSIANAEFLKTFEVWGMSVNEPIFHNEFYIDSISIVGQNHAKMVLIESVSSKHFSAIAFNKYMDYKRFTRTRCHVAYRLSVNQWQGRKSLSLIVSHIEE